MLQPEDLEPYEEKPEEFTNRDWVVVATPFSDTSGFFTKEFNAGDKFEYRRIRGAGYPTLRVPEHASHPDRYFYLADENVAKLRKCPPPEKKAVDTTASLNVKCNVRFSEHWAEAFDRALTPPLKWSIGGPINPRPIFSPIPSMELVDSAVKAYRNSKLNSTERRLRKAGFKDDCGNWTDKAVRTFIEIQLDQNGQKLLEPIAKDLLRKAKDDEDSE